MARIRSIRPEFFTSLTIGSLNPLARLTFIGLWTYCDDDGRGIDDVRLIRAAIWPVDDRKLKDVESDLVALAAARLIVRYVVDGKRYLAITNWAEHQRIANPRPRNYPPPTNGTVQGGTDNGSGTIPESFVNGSRTVAESFRPRARVVGKVVGREGRVVGKERNLKKAQPSLVPSNAPDASVRERAPPLAAEVSRQLQALGQAGRK